jgi:hypothetical protein
MSEANFFRLAAERFDYGDLVGSAAIAEMGLRDYPEDAALWQILGCARGSNSQPEEAIQALETASLLGCLGPLARLSLLESHLQIGNIEAAKTELLFLAPRHRCPLPCCLASRVLPDEWGSIG